MITPIQLPYSSRQLSIQQKFLVHAVLMAVAIYSGNVQAQTVEFSSVPLTVATAVPANLMYIHDDSNSMYWSYMPDDIHRYPIMVTNTAFRSAVPYQLYMSSEFNKAYYNPVFKYVPPPAPPGVVVRDADNNIVTDGTLGNAKFTNAWFNGYDLASRNDSGNYVTQGSDAIARRYNLATSFTPTDHWSILFNNASYNGNIKGTVADRFTEFLPGAPTAAASYYVCSPNAWIDYPLPTNNAGKYNVNLCQQRFLNTDEEKQNFANWYSYYRTRNYASKAGIGRAFEQLDPSVRLGWGLINKKNSVSIDGKSVNTVVQGVRTFDQARKREFLEWLYKVQPAAMNRSPVFISTLNTTEKDAGGTPLRRALDHAGRYYDRTDGSNLGPWADNPANPGTAATEKAAACRKSFTVLMTDGYWNSDAASTVGIVNVNVDGSAPSPFGDSYSNTLADIAYYYWNKKLVPNAIPSNVAKVPAPEAPGKFRNSATHQHMTTFTIGLAVEGRIDKDKAFRAIHDPSVGTVTWPNPVPDAATFEKIDDLLHAAVNGRGDFFSASNPDEFVHGMSSIINSINASQKSSSGNLEANTNQIAPLATDVYIYKTNYKPEDWSGELIAQRINAKTGLEEEVWFASEQMPSPTARKIFTYSSNSGVPFVWASLNASLQNALRGPGQLLDGQNVLEYIRGSSANEGLNPGQFRPRYRADPNRAPLGDSPHNTPAFAMNGSSKTIFLGANDGMLHAFDAETGAEKFAYIPSPLISKLAELTNGHNSFVDGEVLVTTTAQTPGKNLLVGALGRGGKGLYGLDVSNPAGFQSIHVKWEFSSPQNCPDPNPTSAFLGNVIGSLVYATINDVPSAVFGNGYNSCSNRAALGVTNVENGNTSFIAVSNETGNGLTPPHIRANATTGKLMAYAGDLRGNMWKFDSISPADALAPRKLFAAGTSQPITARPLTAALNLTTTTKRVLVYFGTGRYLSVSDRSNTAQQSIYGLVDMDGSLISLGDLRKREFSAPGSVDGVLAKTILPLPGNPNMDTWKGWYIPLAEPGERVVSSPIIVQTAQGDVAIFTTIIPAIGNDSCNAKGTGWLYVVNAQTGGALDFVFVDINNDGKFDEGDMVNGKIPSAFKIGDLLGGMPGQAKIVNGQLVDCAMDSEECITRKLNIKRGENRLSWREIIH